jgi:hypothetical protein
LLTAASGLVLPCAAQAADAGTASLDIRSTAADATRAVTGSVVLAPRLTDDSRVKAQLSIDAGVGVPAADRLNPPGLIIVPLTPMVAEPRAWKHVKLAAQASWQAPHARVSLEALGEVRYPQSGGLQEDRIARASARFEPVQPVSLDLTGEVIDAQSVTAPPGASSASQINVRKLADAVAAGVSWQVAPILTLRGSQRFESASLVWRGAGLYQGDGGVSQPRLESELSPWQGGKLDLVAERTAAPFDASKFAALASAMFKLDPGGVREFRPDQEWRLAARASQAVGPVNLTLSVADAQLISSTELGLNALGDAAPVSVGGGRRSDVNLGMDMPVQAAGAPVARLKTAVTLRISELRDPITGATRSISGEAAYDGLFSFSLSSPMRGLSFGLDTRLTGPRTYYEPARVREVEALGSIGSFVEYQANAVAVRLQIDNLLDSASRTTDTLYQHDRSSGQVIQVDHRSQGGAGVSLVLRRKV